jgi:hypothetical protein
VDMKRFFVASCLLVFLLDVGLSSKVSAAGAQEFFAGTWRCQGQSLNVSSAFGPWYTWRSNAGKNSAQSFVYHDNSGGGWVWQGVDSSGGYWTLTSPGWKGNQLTFNGSYTNVGTSQSQRRVITRNSKSAFTLQTWRNNSLVSQTGCNR